MDYVDPIRYELARLDKDQLSMKNLIIAIPIAFVAGAALVGGMAMAKGGSATTSTTGALAELSKGNQRFVTGGNTFPRTGATRRAETAKGQKPMATVLTCADSRVSPEFIFDQGIGDLFVIRVAGNVADTDEIGTIEYGVHHLKTPVLIVLGHTECGAVKAVIEKAEVSQNIKWLVDNIVPAVDRAKVKCGHDADKHKLLNESVRENVVQSIHDILKRSADVREAVAAGHLQVLGAVYDIETGKVQWVGSEATKHTEH